MPEFTVAENLNDVALGLSSGLNDLLVLDIGGNRILYALNRAENKLLQLTVSGLGQLSLSDTLQFSGTIPAGTEARLAHGLFAGGGNFLTLSGLADQYVSLASNGAFGLQALMPNVGTLEQVVTLSLAGTPVILAAAPSGGLNFFADAGSGYIAGNGLSDSGDAYLADVSAAVGFVDNGISYVATTSATEHGVNLVSVSQSGLVQASALGAANGLPVGAPSDIAALTQFDQTWVLVASNDTSSVSALKVQDGALALADHIYDGVQTRFQGASQVAAVTHGDFAFAVVGGAEGGVSLLTMLPSGRLVHLDSMAEDETVFLDQISDLELYIVGNSLNVVAASSNETGLTRVEYDLGQLGQVIQAANNGQGATGTQFDDQIIGSVAAEALAGSSGADILLDGQGVDTLTGGEGADLFVLTADGQTDNITDFETGVDRLDLSGFDFLYDVSQLSVSLTATGATVSFGGETLNITTSDLSPLNSSMLTTEDILNIDRPPFLLIGREIVGTSLGDVLNGGIGDDTISGIGGDDSLVGASGNDVLSGNQGNDTVSGDGADDSVYGGAGDDLLFGGDGNDLIYGDDWA
ncbi:MAG: hypothetical protein AAGL19_00210 [Pseudomonadota bacterium]